MKNTNHVSKIINLMPLMAALNLVFPSAFLVAGSSSAKAQPSQQARTSDFLLSLHPSFHFSQGKQSNVSSADCKTPADADDYFSALSDSSRSIKRLEGISASFNFLSYAYRGRLSERDYANVDEIVIQKIDAERSRIYAGSRKIGIYCGFNDTQILANEWVDAGLERRILYKPLPPPSALEQLSAAYVGQNYTRVEESMLLRGFKAVKLPTPIIERCSPGIELICEKYGEAVCERDVLGDVKCGFVWADENSKLVMVSANVGAMSRYFIEIKVNSLSPVGR
ncbi:hypothetical protein FF100_31655 [Methylobacterium terricola]|uniref:Uncharacterized protein n=1 Tax=Methylobacterium terricola TaxID=2583531 RepID=A0A5C4L817_9HYPH|nr:hypothetical protein [Methylobacterium terricola]TNC07639.1 hypothetical protein FF100_31655 [Methylobacterium terricola]